VLLTDYGPPIEGCVPFAENRPKRRNTIRLLESLGGAPPAYLQMRCLRCSLR
jgi:hypothetical protein